MHIHDPAPARQKRYHADSRLMDKSTIFAK